MHTRRDMAGERFRTLVLGWLAELPAGGWEGTSHDLGDELAAFAERTRAVAFVPLCPGRKVAALAAVLVDSGFAITHHRSKHARTLRLTRVSVPTVATAGQAMA
jgi:hypothetical protein